MRTLSSASALVAASGKPLSNEVSAQASVLVVKAMGIRGLEGLPEGSQPPLTLRAVVLLLLYSMAVSCGTGGGVYNCQLLAQAGLSGWVGLRTFKS